MHTIKKLNKISPVIYDYLPKENYNVSSHLGTTAKSFIVRSADCHGMDFFGKYHCHRAGGRGDEEYPDR